MSIRITPIGRGFGAVVSGIDLRAGIDADLAEAIEDALARHGVLAFPGQPLDDDRQQRFIERFGPPVEIRLQEVRNARNNHPHFFDVATVDDEGRPIDPNSARGLYARANLLWHTDGSQVQPPVRLTALSARVLPPEPPPTEFADMRAAYDALDPALRARIDGLRAVHSIFHSRAKIGMDASGFSAEAARARPPVDHPLVRTNRRTGRKALYLASHASHVIGMPLEEGRALIDELTAFATQPRFVHAHAWQPDDLVMWDDSWTMHRATPYDGPHPRVLRWCGVQEPEPV
jgi:alpha-ketoglutarate-dependent 2,4-dichlorophenoxyacetate dioxygenase